MAHKTLNITETVQNYMETVTVNESVAAKALREKTKTLSSHVMQISPEQGQFMAFLIRLMGAKRVLELGTYTGYSALVMTEALPEEGKLVTCDIDEVNPAIAKRFWEEAGVDKKIEFRCGPALDSLDVLITASHSREGATPNVTSPGSRINATAFSGMTAPCFDFIFIDADKGNYDNYYEKSLELLKPGGLIALDNMLWSGKVADPSVNDDSTTVLRNLNAKITQDRRVTSSLVPIGDGMMLAWKAKI